MLYICCSYVCGCLFFYPPTHTFFGSSRHVTHLAYTWTCVCNEPEIKVRQHSREDIKVIYNPGRCYENLLFYFFFTFYFLRTLDFAPSTLDMLPSTKTQTLRTIVRLRKRCTGWSRMLDKTCCNYTFTGLIIKSVAARCH